MKDRLLKLFDAININPNYKGYAYLMYLVEAAAQSCRLFKIKDLYSQAAAHFNVAPETIAFGIRFILKSCQSQNNAREIFLKATGFPAICDLTPKEFVEILSDTVVYQF